MDFESTDLDDVNMKLKRYLFTVLVCSTLLLSAFQVGAFYNETSESEVQGEGNFTISYRMEEREIVEGEEAVLDYEIENTGEDDTQDINFTVYEREGEEPEQVYRDVKEDLTLSSSESYEGTFTWQTEEGDASEHPYLLEVATQDEKEELSLEVLKADAFTVRARLEEREIVEGEEAVMNYTVKNTGEKDTQDITFTVRDRTEEEPIYEDVEELTLGSGESDENQFTWQTEENDAGRYVVEIASEDDKDDSRLEVLKANAFTVQIELEERDAVEGEDVTVNYVIVNTGEEDTQDIGFNVSFRDDSVYEDVEEGVTVSSGEKYEDSFVWSTEIGDAGRYDIEVFSEDDKDSNRFEISAEGGMFSIDVDLEDRRVKEGEEIVLDYEVNNTGEEDTQDVTFKVLDEEVIYEDVEELTLGSGQIHNGEFTWQTEEGDSGEYVLRVQGLHDSVDRNIVVEEDKDDEETPPDEEDEDEDTDDEIPGFTMISLVLAVSLLILVKSFRAKNTPLDR
ncbi:MAG: CARDB domain-containing protein [Candidatus Saliniplasma sp.]